MDKAIKIILAIFFFLCLADMPYGYYQFVRFIAMIGFGYLAYSSNQLKKETETIVFVALAILFQPFFKIALGRTLWNIIDLIVGVGLLLSLNIKSKEEN
jgi:hypothetical protein